MVEQPAYTRYQRQISVRSRFESWWGYHTTQYGKEVLKVNYPIKLNSLDALHRLNDIANKKTFEMKLEFGDCVVDAKSLLGLYLVLGKPALLVVPDDIELEYLKKLIAAVFV